MYFCSIMIEKKQKRGGLRAGAGAPLKYGEALVHITARVPKSKSKFVKQLIKEQLNQWVIKK